MPQEKAAVQSPDYSTHEVASEIAVSMDTLYRWLREGRLQDPARLTVGKLAVRGTAYGSS